jgi:hypothetical protein
MKTVREYINETISSNVQELNNYKYKEWKITWNHQIPDEYNELDMWGIIRDRFPKYLKVSSFKAKMNEILNKITSKKVLDEISKLKLDNNNPNDRILINLTKSKIKMIVDIKSNNRMKIISFLSKEMSNRSFDISVNIHEATQLGFNDVIEVLNDYLIEDKKVSAGRNDFYIDNIRNEYVAVLDDIIKINIDE